MADICFKPTFDNYRPNFGHQYYTSILDKNMLKLNENVKMQIYFCLKCEVLHKFYPSLFSIVVANKQHQVKNKHILGKYSYWNN